MTVSPTATQALEARERIVRADLSNHVDLLCREYCADVFKPRERAGLDRRATRPCNLQEGGVVQDQRVHLELAHPRRQLEKEGLVQTVRWLRVEIESYCRNALNQPTALSRINPSLAPSLKKNLANPVTSGLCMWRYVCVPCSNVVAAAAVAAVGVMVVMCVRMCVRACASMVGGTMALSANGDDCYHGRASQACPRSRLPEPAQSCPAAAGRCGCRTEGRELWLQSRRRRRRQCRGGSPRQWRRTPEVLLQRRAAVP